MWSPPVKLSFGNALSPDAAPSANQKGRWLDACCGPEAMLKRGEGIDTVCNSHEVYAQK
jgi:hypothetical protein